MQPLMAKHFAPMSFADYSKGFLTQGFDRPQTTIGGEFDNWN
jgi:hypothetical protein